jgi:hypothetical protein
MAKAAIEKGKRFEERQTLIALATAGEADAHPEFKRLCGVRRRFRGGDAR